MITGNNLIRNLAETVFPSALWRIPGSEKILYLTFDDGPVPGITSFVIDELGKYQAKATFFCVGENVFKNEALYREIISRGHTVGNHTYHHLNGWKTNNRNYLGDVEKCGQLVYSKFFRPPYGRMSPGQYAVIRKKFSVVMWDVLSRDYDPGISPDVCFRRVIDHSKPGSVVVFHDSAKAATTLKVVLPKIGRAHV